MISSGLAIAIYESDAPVFAETSIRGWEILPQTVWADEKGLWATDQNGVSVLGVSAVDGESWGGFTLNMGDIAFGRDGASDGGWLLFDRDGVSSKPLLIIGFSATSVLSISASGASIIGSLAVSSPGQITAGGGEVVINADGIKIDAGTATGNKIRWADGASIMGEIYTAFNGSTSAYEFILEGYGSGTYEFAHTQLKARSYDSSYESTINLYTASVSPRSMMELYCPDGPIVLNPDGTSYHVQVYSSLLVDRGIFAGDMIDAGAGNIGLTGNIYKRKGGTDYTGYIAVPLTTPWTKSLTSYSDVGTSTQLDISTFTNAPADTSHVRGVLIQLVVKDSATFPTGGLYWACGRSSTYWYELVTRPLGGDYEIEARGWVFTDANGDIWYRCNASGSNTLDVTFNIYGILV